MSAAGWEGPHRRGVSCICTLPLTHGAPGRGQEYTPQVCRYIHVLQVATERKVTTATLVFVGAPQTMEASHEDLAPVVDAALEELGYITGRK